jgi:hypothetical protein
MQLAAERCFRPAMFTALVTGTLSGPVATAAFRSSRLRPVCFSASCTAIRASVSADSPVSREAPPRISSPFRITALMFCDPMSIPTTAIICFPFWGNTLFSSLVVAGLTGPGFQHLHERLGTNLHLRARRVAVLQIELQHRDAPLQGIGRMSCLFACQASAPAEVAPSCVPSLRY